jgi:hypothetical protein
MAIDCDNKAKSTEELFMDMITVDDQGNAAIRTQVGVDSGVPFIDCDNKDLTFDQILRSLCVVDCNGKPALNLAAFPCV